MKRYILLIWVFVSGCGLLLPWRNTYLKEGTGKLTSDDVMQRMGPPHSQGELSDGSIVWSYRYSSSSIQTNQMGQVYGDSSCIEYLITFDKARVLKSHKRQGC